MLQAPPLPVRDILNQHPGTRTSEHYQSALLRPGWSDMVWTDSCGSDRPPLYLTFRAIILVPLRATQADSKRSNTKQLYCLHPDTISSSATLTAAPAADQPTSLYWSLALRSLTVPTPYHLAQIFNTQEEKGIKGYRVIENVSDFILIVCGIDFLSYSSCKARLRPWHLQR
jgi:hypothetical protein